MSKEDPSLLDIELAIAMGELAEMARRLINMFDLKSKDKMVDKAILSDFKSALKADPSTQGKLRAYEILSEVSYFDEVKSLIEA